MSITIKEKTTSMQVEAIYDDIKLLGTANVKENQKIQEINGSIYRVDNEEEKYLGSFALATSLSICLDDKREISVMAVIAGKVNCFIEEITAEVTSEENIN